ncbi:MAG: hypothetical protein JSV80_17465 [Acidobacteriota bacterium]|nr:MAG: hypothetical protein JSV80_17465 [Acidobacteriota bacterium]
MTPMIDCTEAKSLLDELVDEQVGESSGDLLTEHDRHAIERHLERCTSCRTELRQLRDLRRATADLPEEIAPERDLFPEIRSRIAPGTVVTHPRAASHPRRWIGLAAAGLLAAGALTAALLLGRAERSPATSPRGTGLAQPAATLMADDWLVAEREYLQATDRLLSALEARESQLSPQTLAVLEKNLQVINDAIEDVRTALESDPANTQSSHILTALYQQRMQLLWTANRLSS